MQISTTMVKKNTTFDNFDKNNHDFQNKYSTNFRSTYVPVCVRMYYYADKNKSKKYQ